MANVITPRLKHPTVIVVVEASCGSLLLLWFVVWFGQKPQCNSIATFKSAEIHHNHRYQLQATMDQTLRRQTCNETMQRRCNHG